MLAEFIQLQNTTKFDLSLPPGSVHITDETSISQIPQTTEHMWINSMLPPQITSLSLSSYPVLRSVIIGCESLKSVRNVTVDGLPSLERFIVNDNSCYSVKGDALYDKEYYDTSPVEGECHICNCPKLEYLRFGFASFCLYRLLELKNLPSLYSLHLWEAHCFIKCHNLILEGSHW